jgi:hypothetical protein
VISQLIRKEKIFLRCKLTKKYVLHYLNDKVLPIFQSSSSELDFRLSVFVNLLFPQNRVQVLRRDHPKFAIVNADVFQHLIGSLQLKNILIYQKLMLNVFLFDKASIF